MDTQAAGEGIVTKSVEKRRSDNGDDTPKITKKRREDKKKAKKVRISSN